jgi:hypothetical protein
MIWKYAPFIEADIVTHEYMEPMCQFVADGKVIAN